MSNYNLDNKPSRRSVNNKSSSYTLFTPSTVKGSAASSGTSFSFPKINFPEIRLPNIKFTVGGQPLNKFVDKFVDNFFLAQRSQLGGNNAFVVTPPTKPSPKIGSKTTVPAALDWKPFAPGSGSSPGEENRFMSAKPQPKPLPPGNPNEYDWNLPPHKWSLPLSPTVVNLEHYTANNLTPKSRPSDKYRRGRLWWKANPMISTVDAEGNVNALTEGEASRKYGFQFIWNPETIGTQVSVQLEAVPSTEDRFVAVSGAFPATQTVSFTVRIDRTNDFACAATLLPSLTDIERQSRGAVLPDVIQASQVEQFKQFYQPLESFAVSTSSEKMSKKLIDLFQRGTIADIEYLYKTINGPGPGGASTAEWTNGRGIKTADIGFLMPTLLHVDVGPLSYDGYVTGLQVTHLAFTPNMTPIRSDLTISLNVLATAALTTANQ